MPVKYHRTFDIDTRKNPVGNFIPRLIQINYQHNLGVRNPNKAKRALNSIESIPSNKIHLEEKLLIDSL